MMKSLTAGACALALTTTLAFAQTSQPQGTASQNPAMENSKEMKEMNKGTTGMSNTTKDMKKDKMMKKDQDGMKK